MVRVLCAGDIHIGRPIAGIPAGSPLEALKTADGWRAIVDLALREQPDLLAISGDIVDERNRYFEAIGPIEDGLRVLAGAGIPVVAVAGNHDWDVLPAVARNNPGAITLLGQKQQWERWVLERDGAPLLHVDGWSFAARHVLDDPLDSYRQTHPGDAPVLGLVHADLDASDRRYAPTALWKLQAQAVDAWLIGHIHAPRLIVAEAKPPVLYPGSPFAIDAGEPGVHGAWMLHLEPGQPGRFEQIAIAPVRYGSLVIDVTGGTSEHAVSDQIEHDIREHLEAVVAEPTGTHLRLLQLRVTLVGTLPSTLTLHETLRGITARTWRSGNTMAIVTRIEQYTTLDLKLDQLAGTSGVPGVLASLLIDGGEELRAAARSEIEALTRKREYNAIADQLALSDTDIAEIFEAEAWRLMGALVAQQTEARS
jgi:DNA repair exonuclease SbcCD nuclease subunit